MRPILLILILAVVVLIGLLATGMININQTRPAQVPNVDINSNGVTAKGGRPPAFDVETGTVSVGTKPENVTVAVPQPTVTVNPAGNDAQAVANNAQ